MPLYYRLQNAHGATDGKLNAAQWTMLDAVSCGEYQLASPSSDVFRAHFKAVVADLVNRYDVDGIHLDRVRYVGICAALQAADPAVRRGAMSGLWPEGTPHLDPTDRTRVVVAGPNPRQGSRSQFGGGFRSRSAEHNAPHRVDQGSLPPFLARFRS